MSIKIIIGLLMGFGIGFGCSFLDIPVPAPLARMKEGLSANATISSFMPTPSMTDYQLNTDSKMGVDHI